MARPSIRLTDAQWAKIEPHLPRSRRSRKGGRPHINHRAVVDGILWVLKTGARWRDLPEGYPKWVDVLATTARMGRGWHLAAALARHPRPPRCARPAAVGEHVHRRLVRIGEKGGSDIGKTKRGKGSKWMVVVDGQGIPVGIHVTSASPAEVTLVDATLHTIRVPRVGRGRPRQKPRRLIGDRGYDSDPLRERLARRGMTVIVPYRKNRTERRDEDGRHLRRYRHRWIIERTFAWLGSFQRLLVRHERLTSMYCSLLYFAAALIALRRF
jgi:transposase